MWGPSCQAFSFSIGGEHGSTVCIKCITAASVVSCTWQSERTANRLVLGPPWKTLLRSALRSPLATCRPCCLRSYSPTSPWHLGKRERLDEQMKPLGNLRVMPCRACTAYDQFVGAMTMSHRIGTGLCAPHFFDYQVMGNAGVRVGHAVPGTVAMCLEAEQRRVCFMARMNRRI